MTAPVFRPNFEKAIKDVHDRVKILEAIPGATGSGVTQIQSADSSVVVTNATGPIVDLSVPPPTSSYQIIGDSTVTDTSDYIPWDTSTTGATLIDTTAPTTPVFIAGGTYIVTINVYYAAAATGTAKTMLAEFTADLDGGADALVMDHDVSLNTGGQTPQSVLTVPVVAQAGDTFRLRLSHDVGSAKEMGFRNALIVKVF